MTYYKEQKELKKQKDNLKRKIRHVTKECNEIKTWIRRYHGYIEDPNKSKFKTPERKITLLSETISNIKDFPFTNLEIFLFTGFVSAYIPQMILSSLNLSLSLIPSIVMSSISFLVINGTRFCIKTKETKDYIRKRDEDKPKKLQEQRLRYSDEIARMQKQLLEKEKLNTAYHQKLAIINSKLNDIDKIIQNKRTIKPILSYPNQEIKPHTKTLARGSDTNEA